MPSERIQRRIDKLLDQAEEAADQRDWTLVKDLCDQVLRLDPGNSDATSYIEASERDTGVLPTERPEQSAPLKPAEFDQLSETSDSTDTVPTSFAGGRYTVKKFLGEGGKKKVYLTTDTTLDRDVAFALIKTEGLDDVGRERIKREAQAMGRMGTHPQIMPIYDLGEEVIGTSTQPFMVQPLMGGGDVEGLIEDAEGPLELETAIKIAKETAQGLVFAHSKGIVHRDLKPGNVWMDEDGAAKIGDFGLAVATDRSRLTVEKVMVGTVNYMPPEQATGGELTPRADLYSLGAMMYEMCTGRVPFMGDDDIAVVSQHVNTPPVAPSWHNGKIPKALDSLILRMMAKDPDERPESAEEVLAALSAIDLSVTEERDEDEKGSLDSMAGGVFVGRQREMDQLKSVFEEMLSGRGRMVTLVGEPGIGKTRTAQELATYASMRGAEVLWGRSYESGGAPPYWPWVQAIRAHASATDESALRSQLGSAGPVIAEVVSDIREKLSDLPEATRIEDPESARFRLFDSISTFLKNVSSSTPLVLMLEDLHWADKPSLMLLEFVARELANSKIMIVGNYRDVELNRRHPLSVTLGDLSRERLFERVVLRGLQRHDVQRFIEIAAGISPPSGLVDTVHAQTEGNPLFVTETVRLLIQEGQIETGKTSTTGTSSWEIRIPEGVREVIGRRLDRLSERCNEVLTIAAVIGRHFRFGVVKMLVEDTSEGQLLDVMDEALSARIIEELPTEVGLYQFTHASMQETLTEELSANRLVRMHARIAEALEEYYGDDAGEHADELVEHFAEAETVLGPAKLLCYSLTAARQATEQFAHEQALSIIDHSLEMIDQSTPSEQLAEFLHLRGEALRLTATPGGMQEAWDTLVQSFQMFVALGNPEKGAEVLTTPVPGSFVTGTAEPVEEALLLVNSDSQVAQLLKLRHAIGVFYERQEYDAANVELEGIRVWAQQRGIGRIESRALGILATQQFLTGEYAAALATGLRGIEVLGTWEDLRDLWWAGPNISYAALSLLALGRPSEALPHLGRSLDLVEKVRDRQLRIAVRLYWMYLVGLRGEFNDFRRLANELLELVLRDPDSAPRLSTGAMLDYVNDRVEEANEQLSRWIELHESNPQVGNHALMTPVFLADRGETEVGRRLAAILRSSTIFFGLAETPQATASRVAGLVLLADANNEKDNWSEFESQLSYFSGHALPAAMVVVDRTLAICAWRLGRIDDAIRRFEAAIRFSKSAGYRPEHARSCAGFADLLIDRDAPGDREKGVTLQDEAISIARELSMKPLLERVLAKREILKA